MSYVVVRVREGSRLPHVVSSKIYAFRWTARFFGVYNVEAQQIVEWQGTQEATINWFNTAYDGKPIRWLP